MFKSEADKLSYALGVNAADQLRQHAITINPDLYDQGLREALTGSLRLMSAEQARTLVVAAQREFAKKQKEEKTRSVKQIAQKNKADGEAFLAANRTNEGVVTLPSGLQYKPLRAGEGKKPLPEDTVVCHYRGTRLDGTEFDSTAKRGQPATLPMAKLMAGWREALQLMPVGSKWQLFIPPNLAYGLRGAGRTIAPNSTLIFELELLGIKDRSVAQNAETADEEEAEELLEEDPLALASRPPTDARVRKSVKPRAPEEKEIDSGTPAPK